MLARASSSIIRIHTPRQPTSSSREFALGFIIHVHFRFANVNQCFRTGYMRTGRMRFGGGKSGSCNGKSIPGATVFTLEVLVRDHLDTNISIDGRQVAIVQPHYPTRGTVGVSALNGFQNEVFFENLVLERMNMPFGG